MQLAERTLVKKLTGLTFAQVSSAMNWSNVSSYDIENSLKDFLATTGLTDVPHILVATHSWGKRKVEWRDENGDHLWYPDDCFCPEGWHVVRDGDALSLFAESAYSGSQLHAAVDYGKSAEGHDVWSLTLTVPVDDADVPYRGPYWDAFHEILKSQ